MLPVYMKKKKEKEINYINYIHVASLQPDRFYHMELQASCDVFDEVRSQVYYSSPTKGTCPFLTDEDSGLGMDFVSSQFTSLFIYFFFFFFFFIVVYIST